MRRWLVAIVAFWRDETGATTVEYALIAALTAVAIVLIVAQLRQSVTTSFGRQKDYFESAP